MDFGSEEVNELLQQAGWTPDYSVDTSEYKRCLEEAGFTVFPTVLDFLKRFGGIRVSGIDPSTETQYEWFTVDPIRAHDMKPLRFYSKLTTLLGQSVCPVGTAAAAHMVLIMDTEGKFYTIYERGVYYMGNTVPEAFQNLCKESRYYKLILTVY
jgi:hypothetical protein